MPFLFSRSSKEVLIGVNSKLVKLAYAVLGLTKIDFGLVPGTGGLRTTETQQRLYAAGVSKADGIENKSLHQNGDALDFFAIDPETGKASWEPELLFHVTLAFMQAAINERIDIETGALFKSWKYPGDAGHIQLKRRKA